MIGQNADAAIAFLNLFRQVADIDGLPSEKQIEFDELVGSVLSPRFPGGLLSYPRQDEATMYYAIAASASEWRKLRPLLIAYAGPTLTSFRGWPEPLQPSLPVEACLLAGGWHIVARLIPGKEQRVVQMTRRSLVRMLEAIEAAPMTTQVAYEPTSRLIARFVDFLNGNNRVEAERILELCRSELRLDALNLLFLRVQLLAHFNDWSGVSEIPEFSSLCYTRKPSAVTNALLEALYQTHLSPIDGENWMERQRTCWRNEVRQFARPLLRLPIPQSCSASALKLFAWDALEAIPRRLDLEEAVLVHRDSIGELAGALDQLDGNVIETTHAEGTPTKALQDDPIAVAQHALANADSTDTLAAIGNALLQFEHLDEDQRQELLRSGPFRSFWQNLNFETGGTSPPIGWIDWLHRLPVPEFVSAFSVLQRAVTEWPASSLVDSVEVAELAKALGAVPDSPPASDRIADAIPLLVSWVVDDPQFPRAAMSPVYETLLYHLVVGGRRASIVYDSAAPLIRALLAIGLPPAQYGALLDDCLELIGAGAGTRNVYWLLDILEETILNTSPAPERRQAFWYAAHARLVPLRTHLSPGQSVAVNKLAASLGWESTEIEAFTIPASGTRMDALRAAMSGTSIAIYSLTESAARQAGQALEAIAPDVKISISSDTGGTAALKSMAQNSDICVVATASAKHAATGFIQQMRPRNKPLLFAAGRGFSSIVRAIEVFLLGSESV
jgi:hypothetical protein